MSLSSVFSTAISGLNASETTIDVTGNNVANANTVGFKASSAVFATQLVQTLSLGTAPNAGTSYGGTDPTQTGLGTQVAAINTNFSQGTLQISSSPSDLAIQGNGFFTVSDPTGAAGTDYYTRNGQFQLNEQNQLTTSSGQVLLGYGVNSQYTIVPTAKPVPLTIPLGQGEVAKATDTVNLQGALPASGTVATTAQIQESSILGDASYSAPPTGASAALAVTPASASGSSSQTVGPAGGGVSSNAQYKYEVVFQDADGTQSVASNPVTINTGATDNEVSLTVPTNAAYASAVVYRTDASGSGPYYEVGSVLGGTTGTTSFTDTLSDTNLVSQPQLANTNTLTGQYSYYVVFATNANGPGQALESRPSPLIGPVNVVDGRIQLTNIPQPPAGSNWTNVEIYRNTSSDTTDYHYVTTLATGTTTFTDSTSDATIANNALVNMNGPAASSTTLLTNLLTQTASGSQNLFTTGTLSFAGVKGQNTLSPRTLTIDSSTTVGELMSFVENSLGIINNNDSKGVNVPLDSSGATPGVSINSQGQIVVVSDNGTDNATSVPLGAFTLTNTSGVTQQVGMNFSTTQQAVGTSTSTNFVVYDSLGKAVNVTVTAVLEAESQAGTTYQWYADSSDSTGSNINVGTGLVTFDGNGNLVPGSSQVLDIPRGNTPATNPLQITLDFSQVSGLAATSASLAASSQDGFPPGTLTSYSIGSDGTIKGVFDNGTQRDLGQVVLSTFANPEGLVQQGQNLYVAGPNSGNAVPLEPGHNGAGTISAGALEQSNTDVGQSLIDLITASTMYQGNTRVISAANTLLQDLLNLNR